MGKARHTRRLRARGARAGPPPAALLQSSRLSIWPAAGAHRKALGRGEIVELFQLNSLFGEAARMNYRWCYIYSTFVHEAYAFQHFPGARAPQAEQQTPPLRALRVFVFKHQDTKPARGPRASSPLFFPFLQTQERTRTSALRRFIPASSPQSLENSGSNFFAKCEMALQTPAR